MVTRLLLASNSPRRRELLAGLDIPMEVVRLKDIDETHPANLEGGDIPLHIARLKMHAYDMELRPGEVFEMGGVSDFGIAARVPKACPRI